MGDFSVSVNGKQWNDVKIRQVKTDTAKEDIQNILKAEKDGYDSVGVNVDGVDYLLYGQANKDLKINPGDLVTIKLKGDADEPEGQALGRVAFVEQESNTFAEGFKAGFKTKIAGIEHSVAGAPFLMTAALIKGTTAALKGHNATDSQIEKVTEGPEITRQVLEDAVKAISSMFGGGDDE